MERSEHIWSQAGGHLRAFLRRFTDPWTRNHRDDLVQEAALATWQWGGDLREPRCLWSAARTIARRVRGRALANLQREHEAQLAAAVRDDDAGERCYRIGGRLVSLRHLRPGVERALHRLPAEDRRLLLDFHAGFCCAELAARCDRSEAAVKTRIHRARRRLQREIEAFVRAAGDLDVFEDQDRGEGRWHDA